jgi:hypothetical protein
MRKIVNYKMLDGKLLAMGITDGEGSKTVLFMNVKKISCIEICGSRLIIRVDGKNIKFEESSDKAENIVCLVGEHC